MKTLAIGILLAMSTSAFADQCQINTNEQAQRAALLLQKGAEVASLCQPCGEKISQASVSVVKTVKTEKGETILNGQSIDLAYTYLRVAPNKYINVGTAIGCNPHDVSKVISK